MRSSSSCFLRCSASFCRRSISRASFFSASCCCRSRSACKRVSRAKRCLRCTGAREIGAFSGASLVSAETGSALDAGSGWEAGSGFAGWGGAAGCGFSASGAGFSEAGGGGGALCVSSGLGGAGLCALTSLVDGLGAEDISPKVRIMSGLGGARLTTTASSTGRWASSRGEANSKSPASTACNSRASPRPAVQCWFSRFWRRKKSFSVNRGPDKGFPHFFPCLGKVTMQGFSKPALWIALKVSTT